MFAGRPPIELGVSTPNYDAAGDGSSPDWLERSDLMRVAVAERVLALELFDDRDRALVVLASPARP